SRASRRAVHRSVARTVAGADDPTIADLVVGTVRVARLVGIVRAHATRIAARRSRRWNPAPRRILVGASARTASRWPPHSAPAPAGRDRPSPLWKTPVPAAGGTAAGRSRRPRRRGAFRRPFADHFRDSSP